MEVHRFRSRRETHVPVGAPRNICEPDPDRYAMIARVNPDGSGYEIVARVSPELGRI